MTSEMNLKDKMTPGWGFGVRQEEKAVCKNSEAFSRK